jgi:hypothetical protein
VPKSASEASALQIISMSIMMVRLFMSLASAECIDSEVEYTTELYSVSPPPVGTKTNKGYTTTWKRHRGFSPCIQVELDFSSNEAPTSSRSISGKFTARLTPTKCSSASLLTARSSFAMQSALPWTKETLLHCIGFTQKEQP